MTPIKPYDRKAEDKRNERHEREAMPLEERRLIEERIKSTLKACVHLLSDDVINELRDTLDREYVKRDLNSLFWDD